MDWIGFERRVSYFNTFFFNRGPRYAFRYLWFHLAYNSSLRDNKLFRAVTRMEKYPRMIEVETTTACNLRCVMCEHTYWDYPAKVMTLEQFKHIIDQFPNLYWIGMTGIGSSFLNKSFPDMLEYVKSKDVIVELYDHFNDINYHQIDHIVRLKLDRLIFSLDAATEETYSKIRPGASFDRVINNIKTLIRRKKELRCPFPQVSFHYIVSKENVSEMPLFVDLVHSLTGRDNIGVMFSILLDAFKEVKELEVPNVPEEIRQEVARLARKYRIKVDWSKTQREKLPISHCTEWTQPFILVDGSVIPCCATNEHNRREFQIKTSLGNVFEDNFTSIWQSERYRDFRAKIKSNRVPPACNRCPIYDVSNRNIQE